MVRKRQSSAEPSEILGRSGDGAASYEPTLLRILITERHWQKFATFERQFTRAAAELAEQQHEPELKKATVSPRQFERWYSGKVKTEPYPDACRILEYMFGCSVKQLLAPAATAVQNQEPSRPKPQMEAQSDYGTEVLQDGARYPAEAVRAVELIDTLAGEDITDSSQVMASNWVSDSAPGVITGYLFSSPTDGQDPLMTANAAAADRVRAFTRHLMDLDFKYGGGHVRRVLLFYFRSEIVPLLRERHPDQIRREIFSAAAEFAQLLGWSAYDAGRHGIAQRYFVQGLRLAHEAKDAVLGGRLLSNLSHQANYLGRYTEAVQFARAAQTAAAGQATPTVNALFLAMEARALAGSGDSRLCTQVLSRAEQAFAQGDPSNDPVWIGYFDALELAGEAAHCFRDLGQARETQLFAERAIDPAKTPPRTQAFISMVNAVGAFRAGNLDEALSLANDSLALTGSLLSSRYVRYLTDFHGSLCERHANDPAVRQFTDLLTKTYPQVRLTGVS
jgi:hypothetical protein